MLNKLTLLVIAGIVLSFVSPILAADVILDEEDVIDLRSPFVININTGGGGGGLTGNDTQKGTDGPYLFNNTIIIFFNESKLNATIIDLDTSTANSEKIGGVPYLFNDTTTISLNETKLNATILSLATSTETDPSFTANLTGGFTGSLLPLGDSTFNIGAIATRWITGFFDSLVTGSINATDWSNVTITESQVLDLTHTVDTNASTACSTDQVLLGNGSCLSSSLIGSGVNTQKIGGIPYLFNDTTTISLNETKLNATISSLATGGGADGNASSICSGANFLLGNGTCMLVTALTYPDTQKDGTGAYLFNDTTSILFNETKLNATITALDTGGTNTEKIGGEPYLFNDTTTISLNETKLNATISDIADTDTQKDGQGAYLFNDTTSILFNETKLNATITALDSGGNTEKIGGEPYLFNDTTTISLNETKLNATISDLDTDTDTQKIGGEPYLFNDTTTITLNETKLNATISSLATGGSGDLTNVAFVNQSQSFNETNTFNNDFLFGDGFTVFKNFTDYDTFGEAGGIQLRGTVAEAKPSIEFYSYDPFSDTFRGTAWIVSHYNLSNGDVHEHFSIETLDNSTGSASVNSHFEIKYGANITRPTIRFPGSDVQFISGQRLYFGDLETQGWIVHNGTSGDLELKTNADVKILATQLDLDGADLTRVDDIFSITGGSIDMKPDTTFRIFPSGQTTRGIQFTDSTSFITIAGTGADYIKFDEIINVTAGNDVCIDGGNCLSDAFTDTNTQKIGGIPYLFNDTTTIFLNETKLNATISDLDTDTIFTPTNVAFLNNTQTFTAEQNFSDNITISDRICFNSACSRWMYDNGTSLIIQG